MRGVDVQINVFLPSATPGGEWSALCALPSGKGPQYTMERNRVVPRIGLDTVDKRKLLTLSRLQLQPLCNPDSSWSIY